ncbi:MAG: hypothetical protein HY764_02260 [Candidatus Portnoybacteria bacterium]|nr:hypothetical protein [Candidatus Portnoybacteria bacterium]
MEQIIEQGQAKIVRPCWNVAIRNQRHVSGFFYPVFEWSWGFQDGLRAGELWAWPISGLWVFKSRRSENEQKFKSLEALETELEKGTIDLCNWPRPPHLKEVSIDILETSRRSYFSRGDAIMVFHALHRKWQALIGQSAG